MRSAVSSVGDREMRTQHRVIAFFRDALGYRHLGDWKDRSHNSNVERKILHGWLQRNGHGNRVIGRVLDQLGKAAAVGGGKTLYDANRDVYGLLRYGVKVQPELGEHTETIWLVDWDRTPTTLPLLKR